MTGLRWRDVDLSRATATVHRSKNGDSKVFPLVPAVVKMMEAIDKRGDDALVFASRTRPDVAFHFDPIWQTALADAKVKDFRFHDLRHSCASDLAQSGATLLEIADVLGHPVARDGRGCRCSNWRRRVPVRGSGGHSVRDCA